MHHNPDALRAQAVKDAERAETAPRNSEYPRRARSVNNALAEAKRQLADVIEQTEESVNIVGNDRESRRERRIARLMRYAAKADLEAAEYDARSHAIGEHIPFGQPILVGHHSERRHRATIKRQHRLWDKWHESYTKAKELRAKAEACKRNNAIYSDDENARLKIESKIRELEARRDMVKADRKAERNRQRDGMPPSDARFGWYNPLPNINAEIKRLKRRLEDLSKREARQENGQADRRMGDVIIRYNPEYDKTELHFPGKPSAEIIQLVKRLGFRWIRTGGCWSRSANNETEYKLQYLAKELGTPIEA